jgi:hypothetical protein
MRESNQIDRFTEMRRTRRNLIAMGAIAASAFLARTRSSLADADDQHDHDGDADDAQCFLKHTRIRTVEGERRVEELAIGDLVPTVFSGVRPIQWIGRSTYRRRDPQKPWAKAVQPVRVCRSALGPETPHSDLFVTQMHALYVDGALVRAGSLINGRTIMLHAADAVDELEFFHIKLEAHDVIYAEGAACETLLTVDESLSNFAEYYGKYGAQHDEETPCAPILSYCGSRRLELRSRLRSAISPLIDCRQQIDIVRDSLEERAASLSH